MIYEIILAASLAGQITPLPVEVEQPVVHRILNTGVETSRFYKRIKFNSDGYETEIPVINGYLPRVTRYKNNSERTTLLELDYSAKFNYSKFANSAIVNYNDRRIDSNANLIEENRIPDLPREEVIKTNNKFLRPSQVNKPESNRTKMFPRYHVSD